VESSSRQIQKVLNDGAQRLLARASDNRALAREHLASRISADWEAMYGHPVYFLETFVDPERFRGTCYRAANWQLLGLTTGRGKNDQTNKPNRPIKEILGLPLTPRFRQLLSQL